MRIVIPLLNLSLSGGIRIAIQYAAGLADRGHQVTILLPAGSLQDYVALPGNVFFSQVTVPALLRSLGYFGIVIALGKAMPACDVILAISWQGVYPVLASWRQGVRIFYLVQHDDAVINKGRSFLIRCRNAFLYRYIYRLPIKKIVVSSWLQRLMASKYGQSSICIPNGVDPKAFAEAQPKIWTPPSENFDILCLARSSQWKGFGDVIAALRKLAAEDSSVRLIVATREKIDLPSDLPIVLFRPENDTQLGSLYRTCSVFVFPSWMEGFGLPPLEAMACGAPVITTDCGGVNDFARHGENCIMIPPHQPDKLVQAINCLRLDHALTRRLAAGGLETAGKFTMSAAIDKLEKMLLEKAE